MMGDRGLAEHKREQSGYYAPEAGDEPNDLAVYEVVWADLPHRVERTLKIYAKAIYSHHSHASTERYRPLFEQSIEVLEFWLKDDQDVQI